MPERSPLLVLAVVIDDSFVAQHACYTSWTTREKAGISERLASCCDRSFSFVRGDIHHPDVTEILRPSEVEVLALKARDALSRARLAASRLEKALERTVAIKVLPAHLSDNVELKKRFEQEARAVSSLNHPHICMLFDVGEENGVDFIVMEYLEGETLAERLKKGALPLAGTVPVP